MMTNKRFRSFFDKNSGDISNKLHHVNEDEKYEFHISDCSSSDGEQENNRTATLSSTGLINWSSDESNQSATTALNSRYGSTPFTKRKRRTPQSSKSTKKPLPLACIKRKSLEATKSPRKILSQQNTFTDTATTRKSQSPWQKVCSTFTPLKEKCNKSALPLNLDTAEPPSNDDCDHTINRSSSSSNDDCDLTINCSSSSSESNSVNNSQRISTSTSCSQKSTPPTELDLFLALIEREARDEKKTSSTARRKFKRCRKGGYLDQLQRALDSSSSERKFLEHDKRLGLQSGKILNIMQLTESFGVTSAKVCLDEDTETTTPSFYMILSADMAPSVSVGSKLEAFFDETMLPYSNDNSTTYVYPNKLLLL